MTGGCTKTHHEEAQVAESKKVSEGEMEKIVERLYTSQTKSSSGNSGPQAQAVDTICKKKVSDEEVDSIVERLYTTRTKSQCSEENQPEAVAVDRISKQPMNEDAVGEIVQRLHTSHTQSSGRQGRPPRMCSNNVARSPADEEELKEIYTRLSKTHTKSSSGGEVCRTMDPPKPPGYGLKMYPVIDGIETRFKGAIDADKKEESLSRLVKTQTTASKARQDNPRILLYPQKTTLMNNVERIRAFQESGSTTRQKEMQRREKWFN